MTNPNCEYGANFMAIHTLAQWNKCDVDGTLPTVGSEAVSCKFYLIDNKKYTVERLKLLNRVFWWFFSAYKRNINFFTNFLCPYSVYPLYLSSFI